MNTEKLSQAFHNFAIASKTLENYYQTLNERVTYLTSELEQKNRQLEKALEEAERNREYLNAILFSLEEAIIVTDQDDRITMMNKSAEEFLDIKLMEAIGRKFKDLNLKIIQDKSDTIITSKGTEYRVIISRYDIRHTDNNSKGSVILIKDITRLRELEQQQERNQRLIAMGEMSAKIVHEIRNPLCSISLYASMLAKDIEDVSKRELANGIATGIDNLNSILNNMLYFARPSKPAMKALNLRSVAESCIKMLLPLIETREITIKQTLRDCVISGDAELIKQAIMNIMVNAIHAMHEGGILSISIKEDCNIRIVEIGDTGYGIDENILEKIFNPFFSTKDKGTGLGLAIASTIMQAHSGYIKVKSKINKGSIFSLCFPVKEEK